MCSIDHLDKNEPKYSKFDDEFGFIDMSNDVGNTFVYLQKIFLYLSLLWL